MRYNSFISTINTDYMKDNFEPIDLNNAKRQQEFKNAIHLLLPNFRMSKRVEELDLWDLPITPNIKTFIMKAAYIKGEKLNVPSNYLETLNHALEMVTSHMDTLSSKLPPELSAKEMYYHDYDAKLLTTNDKLLDICDYIVAEYRQGYQFLFSTLNPSCLIFYLGGNIISRIASNTILN